MGAHSTPRRSGRGRPRARTLRWRGRGTCTSPENFGSGGEAPPPPHPLHLQTRQTQGEELQGNLDTRTGRESEEGENVGVKGRSKQQKMDTPKNVHLKRCFLIYFFIENIDMAILVNTTISLTVLQILFFTYFGFSN